jgi:hypothetical protein
LFYTPRKSFTYLILLEINKGVRKKVFPQEKGKCLVQQERVASVKTKTNIKNQE